MAETASQPKYPDCEVELTGKDSNALAIVSEVKNGLRRHGVSREEQNQFRKEALSGDYDNVIQTAMAWVNVV